MRSEGRYVAAGKPRVRALKYIASLFASQGIFFLKMQGLVRFWIVVLVAWAYQTLDPDDSHESFPYRGPIG